MLRRQFVTGLRMTVAMIVLVGLAYPFFVTGIAQALFSHQAGGSLVSAKGKVVGSSLIGQNFTDAKGNPLPQYFQPRPSATGGSGPYDAMASGSSNLGPSNKDLLDAVKQRIAHYRSFNDLPASTKVPVDAVTASGSGLDPDISVANARMQATRVATARHVGLDKVLALVGANTHNPALGVIGEKVVNVLELNIALDNVT